MVLLGIAFLAGVLTVLAPCTISLLPVIVGGSIGEGRSIRRAVTVTASLGISVVLFTLILKVSTAFISVPQEFWQILSGVIIFLLGLSMVFPSLYERLPWVSKLNQGSNKLLATGYNKKNFWGDVIIGSALGPVFSSCSPTYFLIIATVLPRSLGAGIVYLLAYALGLSGSLLVVAFAGQKLMKRLGGASDPRGWVKRSVGILFVLIGIAIGFGYDKKLETGLINAGFFDVTKVEQKLLEEDPATRTSASSTVKETTTEESTMKDTYLSPEEKAKKFEKYHEIVNPSGFINTDGTPIKISDYIGKKVILVDFWTYSCINCQRTLPYMKEWYTKYEKDGLEIISIHTPEFSFEKVQANVEKAAKGFGLTYPIVMDNDYGTWNSFHNQYWPRKYLIDIDGYIVYDHAGEGSYSATEEAIQNALKERSQKLSVAIPSLGNVDTKQSAPMIVGTPEIYFGSGRNEYLANGTPGTSGEQSFVFPSVRQDNGLYLSGTWNVTPEYAEAVQDTEVSLRYQAKNVYMVASSAGPASVEVFKDGVSVGTVFVGDEKLYTAVETSQSGIHTIMLKVPKGVRLFTFTFG